MDCPPGGYLDAMEDHRHWLLHPGTLAETTEPLGYPGGPYAAPGDLVTGQCRPAIIAGGRGRSPMCESGTNVERPQAQPALTHAQPRADLSDNGREFCGRSDRASVRALGKGLRRIPDMASHLQQKEKGMKHIILAAIITAWALPATANPPLRGDHSQGSLDSETDEGAGGASFRVVKKYATGYALGGVLGVIGLIVGAAEDEREGNTGLIGENTARGVLAGYLGGTSLGVGIYDRDRSFPLSFAGGLVGSLLGLAVVAETESSTLFWVGLPAMAATATSEMSRLLLRDRNLSIAMRPNVHGQWVTTLSMRF